jgi:signal transduction histidine kinase
VAIARTDELVRATADLNRAVARDASEMIVSHRDASRQWGFFLDGLSAMLAAIAAYAVIRVVRRFRELMNERVAELETFAARVAHDIRSPLGAVGFALELAKGRPGLDEKTTEILARGSRTLQRLGTLVDGLLVFAASGRPPLGDRGTNVTEVIAGVVEDARAHADDKGIELTISVEGAPPLAACSPGVLASISSNLVGNAIKYMGEAVVRRIDLRVRRRGRHVRVEVEDTGPGIADGLREKVFDPHVRGASTSGLPGLGLGLATVRRLVDAHGGEVGVQPRDGGGSAFWFELPEA